jgi:hypothetical protein
MEKITSITPEQKEKVNQMIYKIAYEIETALSDDDFFLAKMSGIKPEDLSQISLKLAIRQLKDLFIGLEP